MTIIDRTELPKVKFKDIKPEQTFKYAGCICTKLPTRCSNRTECNAIDNEHYDLIMFSDDDIVYPVKATLIIESNVNSISLSAEDYNG